MTSPSISSPAGSVAATSTATRTSPLPAVTVLLLASLTAITGCTTKKYVRNQVAPVVQKTNELDDQTAANNRALQNLDTKTQAGISQAQSSATQAQTAADAANASADQARAQAQEAVNRADSLSSLVANLDSYHKIADVSVQFAFNKAVLTRADQAELDRFAAQLDGQKSYILQLTGGTDSVGAAAYNYELSERRAQAVVQYLAAKYHVPAHRFYLIGLGKDQQVAPNSTAAGRAQNRRVEIQLLTNQGTAPAPTPSTTGE